VGRCEVAGIDPGPDIPAHIESIGRALDSETITHIVVTHTHRDHVGGLDDIRNDSPEHIPVYVQASQAKQLKQVFYYFFEPLLQEGGGSPK
ncbi:MAG: MBL fold metallo-hydrolase, partial [Candidatus Margulisiibacteriota bacterium]